MHLRSAFHPVGLPAIGPVRIVVAERPVQPEPKEKRIVHAGLGGNHVIAERIIARNPSAVLHVGLDANAATAKQSEVVGHRREFATKHCAVFECPLLRGELAVGARRVELRERTLQSRLNSLVQPREEQRNPVLSAAEYDRAITTAGDLHTVGDCSQVERPARDVAEIQCASDFQRARDFADEFRPRDLRQFLPPFTEPGA